MDHRGKVWPDRTMEASRNMNEFASRHMVLHMPIETFLPGAQTFSDCRQNCPVAEQYHVLMSVFLEIGRLVNNAMDKPAFRMYIEPLQRGPSSLGGESMDGFRLHGLLSCPDKVVTEAMDEIMTIAKKTYERHLSFRVGGRASAPYDLGRHQSWKRIRGKNHWTSVLAAAYLGHAMPSDSLEKPLGDTDNPAHPLNLFSLENACADHHTAPYRPSAYSGPATRVMEFVAGQEGEEPEGFHPESMTLHEVRFPIAVHAVSCNDIDALNLLPKYFPWYQEEYIQPILQLDGEAHAGNQSVADVLCDGGSAMLQPDPQTFEEPDGSLQRLRREAEIRRQELPDRSDADYGEAYQEYQRWCSRSFSARCWTPGAQLSLAAEAIRKWSVEPGNPDVPRQSKKFENLSAFGNMMVSWNAQWEKVWLVMSQHSVLSMLMMGRLNAYKQKEELHFNFMATGPGATSKSFLFDLVSTLSIPGTIDSLTYQTEASDAVDVDRNDQISLFHECPSTFFRQMGNSQAENRLKNKLTECRITARVFQVDENTGRRTNRNVSSQCIGSFIGATNEAPDPSKAIVSRMFLAMFDKTERSDCNLTQLMSAQRRLRPEALQARKAFVREHQWYQYATFLVEKYIYIGAIEDVDMSVAETILHRCTELLEIQNVKASHPRDYERVSLLARSMTIVAALYEVYCLTDREFSTDTLTEIEPYLICTEEIALCAFQMMSSQYVRPEEAKLIQVMCDPEKGRARMYKTTDAGEIDPRYIELQTTGRTEWNQKAHLARSLASIPGCKMGENNIMIILETLLRRSVRSPAYTSPGIDINADTLSIDTSKPRESIPCVEILDGQRVMIATHLWMMSRNRSDVIAEAIQNTQHAASREETFILGKPMPDYPQLLDCTQRKPTARPIVYTNMLAMDAVTADLLGGFAQNTDSDAVVVHREDLEGAAFRNRQERLGYAADAVVPSRLGTYRYPEDMMQSVRGFLQSRKRKRQELDS